MRTINLLDKNFCTGCGSCYNICPVEAISMRANDEGFLYPQINTALCVGCGLCAKRCPQLLDQMPNVEEQHCFAAWAKDELRGYGSSGGIFPVIAEQTIKKGGVVYGAAFSDEQTKVLHVEVKNKNELWRLYKSKYVQSDTGKIFAAVKAQLEKKKDVLFCGCPCQVDGLKTFLGKDYENLITVDILCHGAPSPFAYRKFLREVSDNGKKACKAVDFRDKTPGWGTLIRVDFDDGTTHYDPWNGNYFRAFLSGLSMRKSCFSCKYASSSRPGDLTLGDFWGVEKFKIDWNDKKGTSLVMCNSIKGVGLLENISSQLRRIEEVPRDRVLEIAEKANGALIRPTKEPIMRKCFFEHLKKDNFSKALKYAETGYMDVGIVGWCIETPRSNYGSTLTDYALYVYLRSLGLSVAVISPPNFDRANAGGFNKKYGYRMTQKYTYDEMTKNNQWIDTFIVASDTLWYYDAFINQGYNFLLDFVDDSKKKISYATSFGNTVKFFPEEEMPYAKYLMKKFDFVSVREQEGERICQERFETKATQVLDPVFLCDPDEYLKVAQNAERKSEGEYLFSYMLDPTPEKALHLEKLARRLKCKLVTITDRQTRVDEREQILKNCGVLSKATIEEFLWHILNAKFVVTDSFHGFCFSCIFRKPFITLVNRARGGARFDTLSGLLDISERMVENLSELNDFSDTKLIHLDWDKLESNMHRETARSKEWLNHALAASKLPCRITQSDILGKEIYQMKKKLKSIVQKTD